MRKEERVEVAPLELLIGELSNCTDYRDESTIKFPLVEVLFLVFCGIVSGCKKYEDIEDFGKMRLSWLRKYLAYQEGIPTHSTIGRVLSILNPRQLEKALLNFSTYGIHLSDGTVLNVDGKKIGRSATIKEQQTKLSKGGKQAIHMVNVYCSLFESCLASLRVKNKSSEKVALFSILQLLDLSHCLLTLDALYCYKDVVKQIIKADADYLIGLKKNQPTLYQSASELLEESEAVSIHQDEQENSHGRLEQRTCTILNINDLEPSVYQEYKSLFSEWQGLTCFIKIVCQRMVKRTNKTSAEDRYYITSKNLTAKEANQIVRGHWGVENKLHWVLDAVFREDDSRKRQGASAANFSLLTKLAFNKIKQFDDPKTSINRKMRKCAMSTEYLERVLDFDKCGFAT